MGKILRRTFLLGAAATAGGMAVGYWMYVTPHDNPLTAGAGEGVFSPYVKIAADNTVTIIVPRAEMGQGVVTTLAALVAEELEVDLQAVKVEHGPASKAYFNRAMLEEGAAPAFDNSFKAEMMRDVQGVVAKFLGMQATGGSSSTIDAFVKMREAGAAARHMLIEAAAARWQVPAATLDAGDGKVTDSALGRSLSYGELAAEAAGLKPPATVTLKPASDWRILGKSQPRLDMRAKVTGEAGFGIDVRLPDMLFATVRMNPRRGQPLQRMDAAAAEAMAGVVKVVHLGTGFAVVARNTWTALAAAETVKADWAPADHPADTAGIFERIEQALASGESSLAQDEGDAEASLAAAGSAAIRARYRAPYLAHACMEPLNATARWNGARLELWCGNQAPTLIQAAAADRFGIAQADVTVNTTFLGGGFGRRFETDFSLLAAQVSKEMDGKPVQVVWSREEDTRHDTYRPGAICDAAAVIGADGYPETLDFAVASQSVMASAFGRIPGGMAPPGPDPTLTEGLARQPLTVANLRVRGTAAELSIPVGFWRSVGHSHNAFFHQCFMDEVAHAAGKDPLEVRLRLMRDFPTAIGVVEAVAAMSDWKNPLSSDGVRARGRGLAMNLSFGTWVAQVVQVADTEAGIRIEKVWCAADLGTVLDPLNVEAQMMSAIVYGLSAAMGQEITFADGAVEQSNFHDYDALRINQCPVIEVKLLETATRMGGAGEPGTPPSLPALANAIFAATGQRIRELPLGKAVSFA